MANKKNNGYKPSNTSSHNKATRITVLVLAFLMVAGILATMIGYIVYAIVGDDHDHDETSSSVVSSTASSAASSSSSKNDDTTDDNKSDASK